VVDMTNHLLSRSRVAGAGALMALVLVVPQAPVSADDSLLVTTPYPSVETQPGSTIKLTLAVASAVPEPVDLAVTGLEADWSATLRGGGFVIHEITSKPDNGASADLEIKVPVTATAGDHDLKVVATDATGGRSALDVVIAVEEQVDSGISLTADFPSLSGEPGGNFSYKLTVDNQTPIEQTFTFDPTAPQGWSVSASPAAEAKAQTLSIDAGATATITVEATSPESADQGQYPIDVTVTGANGATGKITLEADVVGTPKLALGTADERLDVSGSADTEKRVPMIIANNGTAALEAVKLAGTAPKDWNVSFDPQQVDAIQPGETAQVTAIVTPSADAVAGDYSLTVRASAGSLSSNVDLRYSLAGSRTLGFVAIGVIAAAFAALAGVFVKFGRR
jgi:uncharacterized membrane protein